jgi:hypothetical protein
MLIFLNICVIIIIPGCNMLLDEKCVGDFELNYGCRAKRISKEKKHLCKQKYDPRCKRKTLNSFMDNSKGYSIYS